MFDSTISHHSTSRCNHSHSRTRSLRIWLIYLLLGPRASTHIDLDFAASPLIHQRLSATPSPSIKALMTHSTSSTVDRRALSLTRPRLDSLDSYRDAGPELAEYATSHYGHQLTRTTPALAGHIHDQLSISNPVRWAQLNMAVTSGVTPTGHPSGFSDRHSHFTRRVIEAEETHKDGTPPSEPADVLIARHLVSSSTHLAIRRA